MNEKQVEVETVGISSINSNTMFCVSSDYLQKYDAVTSILIRLTLIGKSIGDSTPIKCQYINYKGIKSNRYFQPTLLFFGNSEHHVEEQWLVTAKDLDKNVIRTFAMTQMDEVMLCPGY